jgi:hypothetical protein
MSSIKRQRFLTFVGILLLAEPAVGGSHQENQKALDSTKFRILQANSITVKVNSDGSLGDVEKGEEGAWLFDTTVSRSYNVPRSPIVYDHGPWIIGKVNGTPAAGISYWGTSFAPGPVIDGQAALKVRPQDSLRYHPYRINAQSSPPEADYTTWPSDLGAPVDPSGAPRVLGDEMVWSVFNAADSATYPSDWAPGPLVHLPVEIRQSMYAHASAPTDTALLAHTVLLEWTIINKGSALIESCFVGLWTDIDFDDMENNFPAVDTTLNLGYCWDGPQSWGLNPYAVGYVLLNGPIVPDHNATANVRGLIKPGFRNLPLSSFYGIIMDVGPVDWFVTGPTSIVSAWNVARGFDKTGGVIIDSVSNAPTRFPYSGDPITGTGWVYNEAYRKGSEGFIIFTGPFNFAPGDTQWVMLALVPARGTDRLQSIADLRADASRLRSMRYEEVVKQTTLSIPLRTSYPASPSLFQNYPNPFNPTTTIRYFLPSRTSVTVGVFSLLGQQVVTLQDGVQQAGYHEIRFDARHLSTGVYLCRFATPYSVQTMKLLLLK